MENEAFSLKEQLFCTSDLNTSCKAYFKEAVVTEKVPATSLSQFLAKKKQKKNGNPEEETRHGRMKCIIKS